MMLDDRNLLKRLPVFCTRAMQAPIRCGAWRGWLRDSFAVSLSFDPSRDLVRVVSFIEWLQMLVAVLWIAHRRCLAAQSDCP